jgi:2,4-dienoyl-CoA reductase (NADPH2)
MCDGTSNRAAAGTLDGTLGGTPDAVFTPGRIGTLRLPHRIVMGSMHLGVEREPGCRQAAAFYAARARGGAGLLVTGGWAVSPAGAGGADYGIVNDPASHGGLAHIVREVHDAGGFVALQLFHAGRYGSRSFFGAAPVAPSAVTSRFGSEPPEVLDAAGIAATIEDFARAAATARALGFDAVELMGSEGYLLNQFCSPLTNLRDDAYGGDAARRRAFPLSVLAAVRASVGRDFPVLYRMSGADLMDGSTAHDETLDLARALAAGGADALNIGIGWHESVVPTVQAVVPGGVWSPFAASVRGALSADPATASTAVISGNRINRLSQARQILAAGAADFVSMARPWLSDPDLIRAAQTGRTVNICIGCDQACIDRSLVGERVSCLVNPSAGFEADGLAPAARPGARYVVIGGGPAGLAAARELALAGAQVTLFEAEPELGGQFRLARLVPGKHDYGSTVDFYAEQLRDLGVAVLLGRPIGARDATELDAALDGADAVVLATGVHPRPVSIPGIGAPGSVPVLSYPEAFARRDDLGERVAIIGGGGIAVDLAHLLAHPGGVTPDFEDGDPGRIRAARARFAADHRLPDPGGANCWGAPDAVADTAPDAATGISTAHAAPRPVTVMRRSGKIGAGLGRTMRWVVVGELRRAGVRMITGVRYRRITGDGVEILADGGPETIPADAVVVAAGQLPNDGLAANLRRADVPFRVIGGARSTESLDAVRAFAEGRAAARDLLVSV